MRPQGPSTDQGRGPLHLLTKSHAWPGGHDDVMQTRSFRGSGEPARVNASSNARVGLGPDPRRALGPAAVRAASTGRTHDRTRPMLHQRKKALVNQAPSTHDPLPTWATLPSCAAPNRSEWPEHALSPDGRFERPREFVPGRQACSRESLWLKISQRGRLIMCWTPHGSPALCQREEDTR